MSDKKTQLESVATDSIQRTGLKDLSFRRLADEVGIKSASVHYYFPGKADLANSLIEKYGTDFERLLTTINSNHSDLTSKLNDLVDIFESVLKDGKFCLLGMMASEIESLDEQGRILLSRCFEISEAWLADILTQDKASLASTLEPKTLAKIIMSGLEGSILLDRVDGGSERLQAQRDLIHSLLK